MAYPKIIVLQEGADLDALASALGVQKIYPDAVLLTPKYLSRRASQVFKDFKHLFRLTDRMPEDLILVLVDTRHVPECVDLKRVKGFIVYDHHPSGEVENFKGKVDRVGATTTLVVEDLIERNVDISPEEATLLIMGIYEDTGSFTYEGTTPRDLKAASWLLSKGASLRTLRRYMSEGFTRDQIEAVRDIISSVEKIYLGGKEIAIATAVLERYDPDISSLLYDIKDLKEADAFFVILEAEGKTYVFGRSQDPEIDAGRILSHFGGGGHREAGALKLENVPAQRIKSLIVNFLKSEGPVRIKVGDVMTSPPFLLKAKMQVKDALSELTDRGFASAPVVDEEGKLVGIVSKKTLLKIVRIFPHEPVESFVVKDFHTLRPEDPVWEAEDILTKFGQTLIPVVEGEKVVGVVTRIDILRKLREDLGDLKAFKKKVRIPEHIEKIAREVGEISKDLGYRAYIVGGVVRDLILEREVWDLDFVVEGDAMEVATKVGERHGVQAHTFPEFGTAHMKIGDLKVEFSTARRETYPSPGSYPKVERASLKEDLIRRDFTINAMAISVNPDDFGTLIDFFGGLRDLKEGVIRVIHPVSFIEDPVRILRALRFAGRFGFRLSKSTEKLLKQAVDLGLLKDAPRGRVLSEIRTALKEDRITEILKLYRKFKVLENVIEGFRWTNRLEDMVLKTSRVVHWHSLQFPSETIDYGWIFLMILLSGLKEETALRFLEEVSAPSWVRENMIKVFRDLKRIKRDLRRSSKNSEVYRTLKGLHLSLLLILMTSDDLKDKVRTYLEKLRYVKVPHDRVEALKAKGISGRELGEEIEKIRAQIMDTLL